MGAGHGEGNRANGTFSTKFCCIFPRVACTRMRARGAGGGERRRDACLPHVLVNARRAFHGRFVSACSSGGERARMGRARSLRGAREGWGGGPAPRAPPVYPAGQERMDPSAGGN